MILFELVGRTEDHPAYQTLATSNGARHCDFLYFAVLAALEVDRPFLSQTVIKAINYHAIACLHPCAGEYRPCPVEVGSYSPPEHYRIPDLMDDFVNTANRRWEETDPLLLAAYVLWRLNWIHPFINGNARTARAACYFVLCVKIGAWPNTPTILPELLRQPESRDDYVAALRGADASWRSGKLELDRMESLLEKQLADD